MSQRDDLPSFHSLFEPKPWVKFGLCNKPRDGKVDTGPWYPKRGEPTDAIEICEACPVIAPCLHYGMREKYGIWGGKTSTQRRKLRSEAAEDAKTRLFDVVPFTPPPEWSMEAVLPQRLRAKPRRILATHQQELGL